MSRSPRAALASFFAGPLASSRQALATALAHPRATEIGGALLAACALAVSIGVFAGLASSHRPSAQRTAKVENVQNTPSPTGLVPVAVAPPSPLRAEGIAEATVTEPSTVEPSEAPEATVPATTAHAATRAHASRGASHRGAFGHMGSDRVTRRH